jgi:hypothetical protein
VWFTGKRKELHFYLSLMGFVISDKSHVYDILQSDGDGLIPVKSVAFSLSPTLIPQSGVGTTCFLSCCDKDSSIIFTTGCLPDINLLETGVGANDCKCSLDHQPCFPNHGGARASKFWSPIR